MPGLPTRTFVLAMLLFDGAACAMPQSSEPQHYPEPTAGSFTVVTAQVAIDATKEPLAAAQVSADFFKSTRATPVAGRVFVEGDYRGPTTVVILHYDLWQRRFGGDPAIIGRTIQIDDQALTVVGIMPRGFTLPSNTQLWMPRITG